jgi:Skp family chaperone for outer membrane proteins
MKTRQLTFAALALAFVAAAAWMLSSPTPTAAQAQGAAGQPVKIATANPSKIFFSMKEKTDVQAVLQEERKKLGEEERSRRQKVEDLRSALELIKPDAPQYEEASKQYAEAALQFKNWGEFSQMQLARLEKQKTKLLFDKITAMIAQIAKERGIDLVVAEQPPINVERISSEQLTQMMAQRQVLYTNASLDLTPDVVAKLDEQYNAQKK